uniref:Uncharacterized protein n=1 Tax=Anguilla anguilla TaxID=7936 RepID=A0A0E9TLE8_ANGAN
MYQTGYFDSLKVLAMSDIFIMIFNYGLLLPV